MGLKRLIISAEGLRYSLLPRNMKYTERWGKIVMYSITKLRSTLISALLMSACGLSPHCLATPTHQTLLLLLDNMLPDAPSPLLLPTTSHSLLPLCTSTMSSWTLTSAEDSPRTPTSTSSPSSNSLVMSLLVHQVTRSSSTLTTPLRSLSGSSSPIRTLTIAHPLCAMLSCSRS